MLWYQAVELFEMQFLLQAGSEMDFLWLWGQKCLCAHAQRTGPWIAVLLQWPVVAAGSRGPGSPRLSVWKGWEQPWVPARIREARAGLKPCHGEAQAPQQCLHFSSCPSELSTASAQSSGACLLGSAGGQASLLCVHGPHGSTLQSELTVCTGGGVLEWDQLRALQGLHFAFHSTGQASQMCSSSRMGTRAPAAAVNPSARTLVPLQPGPAAWQGDLLWLGSCGLQDNHHIHRTLEGETPDKNSALAIKLLFTYCKWWCGYGLIFY
ncbi:uncharacterized protein LOC135174478 [Pogoniulus pusillus]|uniref:uncharacterized protein LOC135174478 n=1 Tax=Pogoniulus pusillus TaxID=488313 RepID=UPI0030B95071